MAPVTETNFPELKLIHRGKVRDLYDMGDSLLMVATDRISAFDVVMDDPIPNKGSVLTSLSLFWFDLLADIIPNHLITADVDDFPASCRPYKEILRGRAMLVKKGKASAGGMHCPGLSFRIFLESLPERYNRMWSEASGGNG